MAKPKTEPSKITVADLKRFNNLLDDARSHESKARTAREDAAKLGLTICEYVRYHEPRKKRLTLGAFNVVIDRVRKGIYWKGAYLAIAKPGAAEKLANEQPLVDKVIVAPIE